MASIKKEQILESIEFCEKNGYFEKTKKGFTKVREVKEETVRKAFLKGNCEVLVILEDSDREILIDDFSSDEDIKKYLGASFINPKR